MLWIASHSSLQGDPRLGADAQQRFLPVRFNDAGEAIDARGFPSRQLACPNCHLEIPRAALDTELLPIAVCGARGIGKTCFLASMAWELRRVMPQHFHVMFQDADPIANRPLVETENELFQAAATPLSPHQKTLPVANPLEVTVTFDTQKVHYQRPFVFVLTPTRGDGGSPRLLCINSFDEEFLPREGMQDALTATLMSSRAVLFLFDPTQHSRLRQVLGAERAAPERAVIGQDAILAELTARLGRARGEASGKRICHTLIVVLTKFDVWGHLTGIDQLESQPILKSLNVDLLHHVSGQMRDFLRQHAPEVVASAEQFAEHVVYVPVSVVGQSPSGPIRPLWVEVPLLYALHRVSEALIPASNPATGTTEFANSDRLSQAKSTDTTESFSPAALPEVTPISRRLENVEFTIHHPKHIQPHTWYPLLAAAHLGALPRDAAPDRADPKAELTRRVEQRLGRQAGSFSEKSNVGTRPIPREAELTFQPYGDGFQFSPPTQSLLWVEDVQQTEFQMRTRRADVEELRGGMLVYYGVILLADLGFIVQVGGPATADAARSVAPEQVTKCPYRKIFASYSHQDLWVVEQFKSYADALGDDFLRDWTHLKAGEEWSPRLIELINEADVFQLFWSKASSCSEFVEREWRHALTQPKTRFVRPNYWENPFPDPPQELKHLHFQRLPINPGPTSDRRPIPGALDLAAPTQPSSSTKSTANLDGTTSDQGDAGGSRRGSFPSPTTGQGPERGAVVSTSTFGQTGNTTIVALVERIETVLSATDPQSPQLIAEFNDELATVLVTVNRRLIKCDELLRRGYSTEALDICKESPQLLDLVAVLDFPERDNWDVVVAQCGLTHAPRLQRDAAITLNEAYAMAVPLSSLLQQYRELGLSRAPLKSRLNVLRQIARLDPGNPTFQEDLHTFERARHQQIAEELRHSTLEQVVELERELKSHNWQLRPSVELVRRASGLCNQLRSMAAVRRLSDLNERLHKAFAAHDLSGAVPLFAKWEELFGQSELTEDSPEFQSSLPVRQWVQDALERQSAFNELEHVVEKAEQMLSDLLWRAHSKRHRAELELVNWQFESVIDRMRDLGIGAPNWDKLDRIRHRIRDRAIEISRMKRRRHVHVIVSTLTCLVVCSSLGLFAVDRYGRWRELNRQLVVLELLVNSGDDDGVAEYIANLPASAKQDPRIGALIAQHDALVRADDDRKARFQQLQDELSRDLAIAEKLDHVSTLETKLGDLQGLAGSDAERSLVDDAARAVAEKRRLIQEDTDQQFLRRLAAIRHQREAISPGDIAELANVDTALAQLLDERGVTGVVRRPAELLSEATQVTLGVWRGDADNRRLVELLNSAVGDWKKYGDLLQAFVTEGLQPARREEFRRLLSDDATVWASIDPWNQALAELARTNLSAISPKPALELVVRVQRVMSAYPQHPAAPSCTPLLEHLKSVTARVDASGNKLTDSLLSLLDSRIFGRLYMVQTKEGKRYYCKDPPTELAGFWLVRYYKDGSFSELVTRQERAQDVIIPTEGKDPWLAPQTQFAVGARGALEELTDATWDIRLVELLERLHGDKRIDSVLRYQVIDQIAPILQQGSLAARTELKPFFDHLNPSRARFDKTADLVNPDDATAQQARYDAEDWFKRLPDPGDALPRIAAAHVALRQPKVGPIFHWVGYLIKDGAGQWTAPVPTATASETGEMVLVMPEPDGSWLQEQVGEVTEGKSRITAKPTVNWVQGRPLFVRTPALRL